MFRFSFAVGVVVLGAGVACAEVADHPPAFSGRSGATRAKLLVASCGAPAAPEVAPPPRQVKGPDAQKFRRLADQWSGNHTKLSAKEREAMILAEVPPKFRQMVKDYFEQLEKTAREKK